MQKAIVKWFNSHLGYGAADTEDGKSVFCHSKDIKDLYPKELKVGDTITLDLYIDQNGRYYAKNIRKD